MQEGTLRKQVKAFKGDRVVFADDREDVVDLVLFATGYRITFPFIEDLALLNWQPQQAAPRLYRNIFPPQDNGLFVAGLLEGAGVGWPGRALQTDLIAAYLTAKQRNPQAVAAFRGKITDALSVTASKDAGTHGIFVDFLTYKHDLQREIAALS